MKGCVECPDRQSHILGDFYARRTQLGDGLSNFCVIVRQSVRFLYPDTYIKLFHTRSGGSRWYVVGFTTSAVSIDITYVLPSPQEPCAFLSPQRGFPSPKIKIPRCDTYYSPFMSEYLLTEVRTRAEHDALIDLTFQIWNDPSITSIIRITHSPFIEDDLQATIGADKEISWIAHIDDPASYKTIVVHVPSSQVVESIC